MEDGLSGPVNPSEGLSDGASLSGTAVILLDEALVVSDSLVDSAGSSVEVAGASPLFEGRVLLEVSALSFDTPTKGAKPKSVSNMPMLPGGIKHTNAFLVLIENHIHVLHERCPE